MDKSRLYPWRWWLLLTTLCAHLCLAAVPGHAQSRFEGEGRVVAMDETQGTVTLEHGPIPGLMPAMRMASRSSGFRGSRWVRWCGFLSRPAARNG